MQEIDQSETSSEAEVQAYDTAAYIFQISGEMAAMASECGMSRLAAALELSRSLAAEALATIAIGRQSGVGNAAPEDAA